MIGAQVERLICQHRRDRKILHDKQPAGWEEKLKKVNQNSMAFVWSKRECALARPSYVKKATRIIGGKLQFVQGSGKGFEIIRLDFVPANQEEPSGPGTYWLSSDLYEARAVCCMSAVAERNGFDLLREAYAGHP